MQRGRKIFISALGIIFVMLMLALTGFAETLYVDGTQGDDSNPGTSEKPLKTLPAAAHLVNTNQEAGPTVIKILPGTYHLTEKVLFENNRPYSKDNRLTIEASVLPDDSDWKPELMPVIYSSALPSENFQFECSIGLNIEVSHVTVRGLKFLGNPLPQIYYYPIGRQGRTLEDLEITQCVFVGDEDALPIQSGVLAHGHGVVVDHSIFYNIKNSVVFFYVDTERDDIRHGSKMTYCIIDGAYETGIWTSTRDEDFEFHHNIITRSEISWMHNSPNTTQYTIRDSIITNNNEYIMMLDMETYEYVVSELEYVQENVTTEGEVQLVKKEDILMPVNYLHIVPGTLGSDLGAGLFKEKRDFPQTATN